MQATPTYSNRLETFQSLAIERINAPSLRPKWKAHFHRNELDAHHSYERLEEAYRFGAEMADSLDFQGRDWSSVARRVRSRWLEQHEPVSWLELHGAIRWGFESYKEAV